MTVLAIPASLTNTTYTAPAGAYTLPASKTSCHGTVTVDLSACTLIDGGGTGGLLTAATDCVALTIIGAGAPAGTGRGPTAPSSFTYTTTSATTSTFVTFADTSAAIVTFNGFTSSGLMKLAVGQKTTMLAGNTAAVFMRGCYCTGLAVGVEVAGTIDVDNCTLLGGGPNTAPIGLHVFQWQGTSPPATRALWVPGTYMRVTNSTVTGFVSSATTGFLQGDSILAESSCESLYINNVLAGHSSDSGICDSKVNWGEVCFSTIESDGGRGIGSHTNGNGAGPWGGLYSHDNVYHINVGVLADGTFTEAFQAAGTINSVNDTVLLTGAARLAVCSFTDAPGSGAPGSYPRLGNITLHGVRSPTGVFLTGPIVLGGDSTHITTITILGAGTLTKTSVFLAGRTGSLLGTSLGPGSVPYPNADMWWGAQTPGWPTGDLANYNMAAALWGVAPAAVRVYVTNAQATTGVAGSAGTYGGLFTSDWRAIANAGAALVISFKYGAGASVWGATADALNAASPTSAQTAIQNDFLNMIQNVKRWKDDSGNTVPTAQRKIILCPHHEPSNDGGVAADYQRYFQAAVNFFKNHGLGGGPHPSTGPGSAWSGTWYDGVEWAFIEIGANVSSGTSAYYPGDGYVTWALFDFFNWGSGQAIGDSTHGSQARTDAQAGQVPQPGRTITTPGHYNDAWKVLQSPAQSPITWYKNGPVVAGVQQPRDVLMGIGEFACSEDIDRFTITSGSLAAPQTHTGIPHLKGDWFTGVAKFINGVAWTAPNSVNNVPADPYGPIFKLLLYWNGQAAGPREWNTIPFQTGDTTGPSTAGAARSYTYDAFRAMAADPVFTGTVTPHTPPTAVDFVAAPNGDNGLIVDFAGAATPGDSLIVSYAWNFGDGSAVVTDTSSATTDLIEYVYAAPGNYTVTLTVTDTNGLTAVKTHTVIATVTPVPLLSPYAGAPYFQPGDIAQNSRFKVNPIIDELEALIVVGNINVVAASGAALTLLDPRVYRLQDVTLSANCTITLPTAVVGARMRVIIRQGGTARTLAWAAGAGQTLKWPAATAPVLTAATGTSDEFEFECAIAATWRGWRAAADIR